MKRSDLRIAIVYNLEEQTAYGEPQDLVALQDTAITTQNLYLALTSLGYEAFSIPVRRSLKDLRRQLSHCNPANTFLFNNCDGFAGANQGAAVIARVMEQMGFRHSGASAAGIALCTDKGRTKHCLIAQGISTPEFQVFEWARGEFRLDFPVIVKPLSEDASLGIEFDSVVTNLDDLFRRVAYVIQKYGQPALVEEFIPGREFSVSLWGNRVVEALPISEADYSQVEDPLKWLLTYEAKWLPESPYYHLFPVNCPASLPPDAEVCIKETAMRAFQAVGLRDFGRVDIRYHNLTPYVIDINELPDLSPGAGFPKSALAAGYTYEQMVERILDLALRREKWR